MVLERRKSTPSSIPFTDDLFTRCIHANLVNCYRVASANSKTVVLPDGDVIKTRRRARKSSTGFDTTKLFIGAEGTLGIVTEGKSILN